MTLEAKPYPRPLAALLLLVGAVGHAHRARTAHAQPPDHDSGLHWTLAAVAAVLVCMLIWQSWLWFRARRRAATGRFGTVRWPICEVCHHEAFSTMRDEPEQPMMCNLCYGLITRTALAMLRKRHLKWLNNL